MTPPSRDLPPPDVLRPHAEVAHADELARLAAADPGPRPPGWRLTPRAVATYLMGGTLADGSVISPKYIGDRRLIEVAIATLATERALLLVGVPGTAKSWVAEHLAAAIAGDSTLLVQGTAGTDDSALRYGWNYARLLAEGPSEAALVPSPVMVAMRAGKLVRVEELTRMVGEVQDSLITLLSEKTLPVPELATEVQARPGFNLIATANLGDRGTNELSAALSRRFNVVRLPVPATFEDEVAIVTRRVAELGAALELPVAVAPLEAIERVVTVFRELRGGVTLDGKTRLKTPSGVLSAADAVSVVTQGLASAFWFSDGRVRARDLAEALTSAVLKEPAQDRLVFEEYLKVAAKGRKGWGELVQACLDALP